MSPPRPAEETARTERLEARLPASLKRTFQRAAALQGRTLTDFVLSAAADAASRVIRDHEVLELSEGDQLTFAQALLDPPAPVPRLVEAAERYRGESPYLPFLRLRTTTAASPPTSASASQPSRSPTRR